jgi:hypothetical protein
MILRETIVMGSTETTKWWARKESDIVRTAQGDPYTRQQQERTPETCHMSGAQRETNTNLL